MTRDEFKCFVEKTLKDLIDYGEAHALKMFPKDLVFEWAVTNPERIEGTEAIIQEIVQKVYLEPDRIFPCVDLVIREVTQDNKLRIIGRISGFEPRPLQKGWSGRLGPFIYGIDQRLTSS
jgi:hypothetical protein